jgi:hypothetical protein
MDALTSYYIQQAGHGRVNDGIGPVYTSTPFVQRGHGLGDFLRGLFRMVKPYLIQGAKTMGRETLRTGGRILSDIAENTSPELGVRDIVSRRFTESAQNLIKNLGGKGRKRKRVTTKKKQKPKKKAKVIKRDIFS